MLVRFRPVLAIVAVLAAAQILLGCTVFFAYDGKLALAGDNEDWHHPHCQIWFVPPSSGDHGIIYLGYGKGEYPQGGVSTRDVKMPEGGILQIKTEDIYGMPQAAVNDQGLFFGGAATLETHTPGTTKKKRYQGHLMHHLLRRCATVEEVVKMLQEYDHESAQGQLLLADPTGDSVILEATGKVFRKKGSQVITNFWQSAVPHEKISCDRFSLVTKRLAQEKSVSVDLARELLQKTSAQSTQYSTVYDLTNRKVHLYLRGNFDKVKTLDIKEELAKGPRAATLVELFSK